ncbi:MAG: hypothetical protein MSB10_05175 [Clostridiales bacterium]|uniref:hypothetical protein n=1 Tax=Flavonifractor porci TaxID=3133422 RepID=UPI0030A1B694|nr:hypothetical protein [Clostridiales bacterium]
MKKYIPALALSLALLLGGCSLSGQAYTVVEPHAEHPALGENESTIKASTYSELVNGVLFFVSQGVEEGVIQITDYNGDVEDDLNRACLEVAKDDPLGAYAVDFIKNDYTTIITTYEATITISYRRSPEQVSSLVNITGTSAIREEAVQALSAFKTELALRVGYFTGDAAAVEEQVRQAYYDTPETALGMPECSVELYPKTDTGTQRIVEILLDYPEEPTALQQKRQQLQEKSAAILTPIQHQIASRRLDLLMGTLPNVVQVDLKTGGATAWDALVGKGANDEGLALAFQLLCDGLGLKGQIVEGTLQGKPHFFNQVSRNGQTVWVDLSRSTSQTWTAAQMAEMGYQWQDQEA